MFGDMSGIPPSAPPPAPSADLARRLRPASRRRPEVHHEAAPPQDPVARLNLHQLVRGPRAVPLTLRLLPEGVLPPLPHPPPGHAFKRPARGGGKRARAKNLCGALGPP